jgi:FMN reductase
MLSARPLIVGIGGATRPNSSSERALKTSLRAAENAGAETMLISGRKLLLPMYEPDGDRTAEVVCLVEAFRSCDGLIVSSPAYHGSISGLIKNALDYTEDLRSDERVYFDGRAVGCIACAGGWQAAGQTLAALRAIAHALRGWPTPLGVTLNTSIRLFDEEGDRIDSAAKSQLYTVGHEVVEFAVLRQRSQIAPAVLHKGELQATSYIHDRGGWT